MTRFRCACMWLAMAGAVWFALPLCGYAQSAYQVEDDAPAAQDTNRGVVSLDFKDANLKDVLKVFSQQSGLNFVASKEIEGRVVTLYMNNVTVEDALKTLLEANNLQLDQSPGSNILIVKARPTPPVETITRVYKIRYYHGNISPGQYLMKSAKGGASGQPQTNNLGLKPIIQPLLSKFGTVVDYMNLVIITDVPDRFKLIDQVINEIDRPIAEVMLEVEVIETTADFLQDLGVKYGKEFARFTGSERITKAPLGPWFSNPVGVIGSPLEDDVFFRYGLISSSALTFILEMLDRDTNTKFLAKPRVLCQDREWAEMKVTSDQVVSLKTTVTSGSGSTTTETEVERLEVGTILRLVPVINETEGFVSLLLEPTISRAQDSRFSGPDGTTYIDPQERSLRTVVMVKHGETISVGGFITTEDSETKTKVPYLGDIPLIGALFRHTSTSRVDKEMLMFITPRIISASEKVDFWKSPAGKQQVSEPSEQDMPQTGKALKPDSVSIPVSTPQGLGFREQEDLSDLRINMTLKGAGAGVVDLVK